MEKKNTLLVNLYAGPGAGKCFGKGTKVLMWNGETKNIEDIVVGDIVMGDESESNVRMREIRGFGSLDSTHGLRRQSPYKGKR